jgi:hypothetical protein
VLHLFYNSKKQSASDWSHTAQTYRNARIPNPFGEERMRLFLHHYKHAIIVNWGSLDLQVEASGGEID